MKIALITNNIVTNIIEVDRIYPDKFGAEIAIPAADTTCIGDHFINGNFVKEEITEPTPDPIIVPEVIEVTSYQAKAALVHFGLFNAVDNYMNNGDILTKLRWIEAPSFRRDNASLLTIAADIGITESQLDDLFAYAKTIQI